MNTMALDALFVINQACSFDEMQAVCAAHRFKTVVVVTTHRVYPAEQQILAALAPQVEICSFSDLLSESDMLACDQIALQSMARYNHPREPFDVSCFMALSTYAKNWLIHQHLAERYHVVSSYYLPGLGVAADYWQPIATLLGSATPGMPVYLKLLVFARRVLAPVVRHAHRLWLMMPQAGYRIRHAGQHYLFFASLKRLHIRPDVTLERLGRLSVVLPLLFLAPAHLLGIPAQHPLRQQIRNQLGHHAHWCMTIHDYQQDLAGLLGEVLVFVDGYHPSNYPRSYIDLYADNLFVVRTMFDERWFVTHGKRVLKPPAFIEQEFFEPCRPMLSSHVLVALNHAGDWTALINRSDTDELVLATAELARTFPTLQFRLRAHPTMSRPEHEGLNAIERIRRFVQALKLPNLKLSTGDLAADLAWCDLCLSEYSQVLLDALKSGCLGLAVNLTSRRSFMQDYADCGFFQATNQQQLIDMLQFISEQPDLACVQQNRAVASYNRRLSAWLGETPAG